MTNILCLACLGVDKEFMITLLSYAHNEHDELIVVDDIDTYKLKRCKLKRDSKR